MSFFGFNTTLPPRAAREKDTINPSAAVKTLDFEDTFEGFEGRLDDSKDLANNDTFGNESFDRGPVTNDFDFFGQTAQLAKALQLEKQDVSVPTHSPRPNHPLQENNPNSFPRAGQQQQSHPKVKSLVGASKPFKTGYEQYAIPDLVVDKDIWGYSPPQSKAAPAQQPKESAPVAAVPTGRKIMSLEEVEASLRNSSLANVQRNQPPSQLNQLNQLLPQIHNQGMGTQMPLPAMSEQRAFPPGPQMPFADPRSFPANGSSLHQFPEPRPYAGLPSNMAPIMPPGFLFPDARAFPQGLPPGVHPGTHPGSHPGMMPTQRSPQVDPSILLHNAERRNRRIQKIHMMSKDNGLMTPHDKNYITRIQLQQLVTAVGSLEKNASENTFLEDFYYQVYSMIRGGKVPGSFTQAYGVQASNRYGHVQNSTYADSHIQRMQQQVARAIEAAKTRPKMTQLAIEGSLGTISFSNSKTPKPLLKVRANKPSSENRPRSSGTPRQGHATISKAKGDDRSVKYRETLHDLERLAMLLLAIEDHKRQAPVFGPNGPSPEFREAQAAWQEEMNILSKRLLEYTRVKDVPAGPQSLQPFIRTLCHTKGKRMVQRIFTHADNDMRVIILTLVVLNLHQLPIIMHTDSSNSQRDHVAPFMVSVIPPIFAQIGESSLETISNLLESCIKINIPLAISTRPGKEIFTMLISRAELLHEASSAEGPSGIIVSDACRTRYREIFNYFFSSVEGSLPTLFNSLSKADREDDLHVWQFLAAMGVASDQQQQQQERLVLGVKDAVMEAVTVSRDPNTPVEISTKIVSKVNLFMKSLGLDVEQLVEQL